MDSIVPLEEKHYTQVLEIAKKTFSDSTVQDIINALRLYFDDDAYLEHQKKSDLLDIGYFVYMRDDLVLALSGIYSLEDDDLWTDWVSWFFVDNNFRKQGIGEIMFNYLKNLSYSRKKQYLKMYARLEGGKLFWKKIGCIWIKDEFDETAEGKNRSYFSSQLNLF